MAGTKVAEIRVPINLVVEGEDVSKKVQQVYKDAQAVAEKNKIKYQLDIDKNGAKEFSKLIGDIKETGKNVLVNIDDEAFLKQVKDLKIKSKKEFDQIKEVFNSIVNINPKNSPLSSGANSVLKDLSKYDSLISKIEEYTNKMKELQTQYANFEENVLKKNAQKYFNDRGNKDSAVDFLASIEKFESDSKKKNLNYKDDKGRSYDLDRFKRLYNSAVTDSEDMFNVDSDTLLNNIDEAVKKLDQEKKDLIKEFNNIKKTIGRVVDSELSNIQNTVEDKDVNTNQPSSHSNVSIKPVNLEEFYKEIENYRKAEINVEVKNKDTLFDSFKEKPIDVKINPKVDNTVSTNDKLLQYFRDKQKEYSSKNDTKEIYSELTSILDIGSRNGLTDKNYAEIRALIGRAKKINPKEDINLSNLVKNSGIDINDFKNKYKEIINSISGKNKNDDVSIDTNVKLSVDDKDISNLKSKIESGINPIKVKIDNSEIGNIDQDIKNTSNPYESLKNDLIEIINLQDKMAVGNKDIAKQVSTAGKLITTDLIKGSVRNGSTTKSSIERTINDYNNNKLNYNISDDDRLKNESEIKTKLAALVASFSDLNKAQELFGDKNTVLWNEITLEIDKATQAYQAYVEIQKRSKSILEKSSQVGNSEDKNITDEDTKKFSDSINSGFSSASQFLDARFGTQISSLDKFDSDIEKTIASLKELSATGIAPIDVKFISNTKNVYEDVEKIKSLSPIQLEISLKDISSDVNSFDTELLNSSVSNLKSEILGIGTAFEDSNNEVLEASIKQVSSIDSITASVKELKAQMNEIGITKLIDSSTVEKAIKETKKAVEKEINNSNSKEQKKQKEPTINESKLANLNKSYDKYMSFDYSALSNASIEYEGRLTTIQKKYEMLKNEANETYSAISKGSFDSQEKANQLVRDLESTISQMKELSSVDNLLENKKGTFLDSIKLDEGSLLNYDKNKLKNEVVKSLKEVYKGVKFDDVKLNDSNSKLTANMIDGDSVRKVTANLREYSVAANQAAAEVRVLTGEESQYLSAGDRWVKGFKSKIHSLTQYMTGLEIVMRGWQEVKEGFAFVRDLDSLMTTIYQTSDITKSGLSELSQGAIDQAKAMKVATEQVSGAIEVYAAYGETVDSLLDKAAPTTMLAKAAGSDVSTASNQILGVTKQYEELEGQEARIVNAYEKIAANIQIDFADGINNISEAVSTAGSVAKENGLEFENFAASVAKVAEVTRQEGSVIGNAYKTIMSRVSRSKEADPDTTAEDRGEAAKSLANVGIQVYDENGAYQDFGKTLDQLSEKWDTLTDAQRANIAESVAGVRNINTFNAMMATWEESKDLANQTKEDPNFYLEVQEKGMDSLQSKLDGLKASMQDFWYNLIDTGVVGTGIDLLSRIVELGQSIINIFSQVGSVFGETGSAIGGMAGAAAIAYATFKGYESFQNGNGFLGGILNVGKDVSGLFKPSTYKNLFNTFKDGVTVGKELVNEGTAIGNTFTTVTTAASSTTGVVSKLGTGFGALAGKLGISTVALGGWVAAAIAVAGAAITMFNNIETSAEAAENASKKYEDYRNKIESLNDKQKEIESVTPRYMELSKEVNPETGTNISLTNEEFAEYQNISNQIADTFPTLISGYDAQGNAIIKLKDGVASLNEEYEKQLKLQEQENIDNNSDDYIKNFNNQTGNRGFWTGLKDSFLDTLNYGFTGDPAEIGKTIDSNRGLEILKGIQGKNVTELQDAINSLDLTPIEQSLLDGFGLDNVADLTAEEWQKIHSNITTEIAKLENDLASSTAQIKSLMSSYMSTLTLEGGTFDGLDDDVAKNISSLMSGISTDQIKEITDGASGDEAVDKLETYVTDVVSKISNNPEAQISLSKLVSISDDTSLDELSKTMENDLSKLSEVLGKDKAELSIQLGLEGKEDVIKKYNEVKKSISDDLDKQASNAINQLKTEVEKSGGKLSIGNKKAASKEDLNKSGWKTDEDKSLMTQTIDTKNGSVVVSPILPNGEILSPSEFSDYLDTVIKKGEKDTKGVTIATFDKKDVKNGKDTRKEADKFVDSLKDAEKYSDYLGDNQKMLSDFMKENNVTTQEQLDLLQECYETTGDWGDAISQWTLENFSIDAIDEQLKQLEENLETVEKTIDNLNSAIDESHSSIGLSGEAIDNVVSAFSNLDSFNYDKLFESTAAGVHLNVQEMDRLNGEYEKAEKKKYDNQIKNLTNVYGELCQEINKTASATERSDLIAERDALENRIKQAQELQSRYEGLTSAVTKWQNAAAGTEEGDVYDSITSGVEDIKELYDKGLIGTREFKAGVQMMTNKDMSGASVDEYLSVYKKKIKEFDSYFNENGTGVENFLEKLQSVNKAWATQNKDGSWSINADIEEMAEKLDLSQSAITEIFKKLNDYGFDIDFIEETDYLKDLRLEAEKLSKTVDKKYQLDLSVTDPEAIQEQIDKGNDLLKTVDKGTEEYKAMSSQLDYLNGKAGAVADTLNFSVNYKDNKDELDEMISRLKTMEKYSSLEINFDTTSVTNIDNQLNDVEKKLLDIKGNDTTLNLKEEGADELFSVFNALINKKQELSRPAIVKLDKNDFEGSYQEVMTMIQDYQNKLEALEQTKANVKVGIQTKTDQEQAQKEVDAAIDAINSSSGDNKKVLTDLGIKPGSLGQDEVNAALAGIDAKTMINAGFQLTEEAKTTMGAATADATKKISADTTMAMSAVKALNDAAKEKVIKPVGVQAEMESFNTAIANATRTSYKNIVVNETRGTTVSGTHNLNGNVQFGGSSYANGTVGAPKDEVSLVGEENPELRVNAKTGRWELLGKNGAEFRKVNKGDLIFNADQTRELFKYGKVKSKGGRGRAFINGTVGKLNSLLNVGSGKAYVSGSYSTSGSLPGSNKFYNNYDKDTSKKKKDAKKEVDNFEESFDWIEVAIDRIERAIERLDTVAQSAYKSFSKRNSTLTQELSKVREEINMQQKAYDAYMREANKISIPSSYKTKIQNGSFSIDTIKGEGNKDLVERIKEYQDLYEKALDAKDAILELEESLGDLASQRFDNVVSEYDAKLSEIETKLNKIETGLDIVEANGQFASRNYYDTLMSVEQENINMLSSELEALNNAFNDAMNTGSIEKYSEQWYSMREEINNVSESLLEAQQSLIEYKNEMREMDWSIFEKTLDYVGELNKESDFLIELLSFNESELFDKKTGQFTDKADAIGGLRTVNYNAYMSQADMYAKKVEELNAEIAKDPTNTILIDKKNEYLEAQREAILNANEEKKAVKDLIENSYEKMLDILQEMIDKRKEALQAEKDLYDYQNSIKDKTKEITDIQKQLAALKGDDSEEAQSKRQQLEDQLNNSQQDLEEMQYDQWLSDQEKLLDDLYTQYEEVLNARLDNIDGLMSEMIDATNANSSTIDQTIKDTTANVGYTVTDGMKGIWSDTGSGIGKVVSDYSSNFSATMTTTNSYIQKCVDLLNQIVNKANADSSKNTGGTVKPTVPGGGGSSGSSGGSGGSSGGSKPSGGGSSSSGNFFVHKKDSYPKNKLQINTSIVDRLKYNDFDSSFSRRKSYYRSMGFSGTYTGSASQNVNMINWMKKNGFKKSGDLKSMVHSAGEDGLFLGRNDDHVLAREDWKIAERMTNSLIDFAKLQGNIRSSSPTSYGDTKLYITLPNVKDYDTFKRDLLNSKEFEKAAQNVTIERALGKNSLKKIR